MPKSEIKTLTEQSVATLLKVLSYSGILSQYHEDYE